VKHSKIEGFGLFAKRLIRKEEMIIEYVGEVIRTALVDAREKYYDSIHLGSYMFCIDEFHAVDATQNGGKARFVNHSCDPNCFSRVINVENGKKIMIYAFRDIAPTEELTYDYKFPIETDPALKVACNCGTKKCRGTMN
jgi:SET domain-containing protein